MNKLGAVTLIFLGEAIAIWAELVIAKYGYSKSFWLTSSIGIFGAGTLLLLGYRSGYLAFKEIWTVTVISVCSIAVLEPMLIWVLFMDLPNMKQVLGLLLGLGGILLVAL